MIDTFALLVSHGMLVLLVLRLMKVSDPEMPFKKPVLRNAKPMKLPVRLVRDALILGFITFMIIAGFKRPFLMSMAYIYVDLVSPQRITYYLLNAVPFSLIMAILAVLFFAADEKKKMRFSGLQATMLVWIIWITITTMMSQLPDFAWIKWSNAWKSVAFAVFLPFVLGTRQRIEVALFFVILCVGVITITGGIKTLLGGGGYGTLNLIVQSNSGLYEGSTIATVSIALIPVILYLFQHNTLFARSKLLKLAAGGLILAALLIPVGTEARTGLICIGVLGLMLFIKSKRKILTTIAIVAITVTAIPFLPESFTNRMSTIKSHNEDESASTRVAVWSWTMDFVKSHPLGGGFEAYRLNKVEYDVSTKEGGQKRIVDQARAFHSAYFETLGEHGYPGFLIYLSIQLATIWQLWRLSRRFRIADAEHAWIRDLANALTQSLLIMMVGALFVGIAFQTILYIIIALSASLLNYVALSEQAKGRVEPPKPLRPRGLPALAR